LLWVVTAAAVLGSCSTPSTSAVQIAASEHTAPSTPAATNDNNDPPLPGMPPVLDPNNIYAANGAGNLSPAVAHFPPRVYVPNTTSNTVDVIDPETFTVIDHFAVGRQPQHVTPSYDLTRLWALNDLGDSVTEIDPATGKKGQTIFVKDPYNMYYTPD